MSATSVEQVLVELRREYDQVGSEVERLRVRLETVQTRRDRLGDAIQKLELLSDDTEPEPEPEQPDSVTNETPEEPDPEHHVLSPMGGDEADTPAVPPDSPVAEYLRGEGRRLRSADMVVDLLDEIDEVVSRNEFKAAFFAKFPREHVELIWENVDNAISTALLRAAKENLILKGRRNNKTDVYASKRVAARLREGRQQREAASLNTGAKEND